MFETAELGRKVAKSTYNKLVPGLREELLEVQAQMRECRFPVIALFSGVDGAGKGELANLLQEWMDPRRIVTRAYGPPSEEARERPEFWRYWRDMPPHGHIGIFLSAWYTKPFLDYVYGHLDLGKFDETLEQIEAFERMLVEDGVVIQKFWMHLGKDAQRRRFQSLEKDPLQSWRVTAKDWEHWRMYDKFVTAAERIIMRTSTGHAPWTIVEGEDHCYRALKVGTQLRDAIGRRCQEWRQAKGNHVDPQPLTFGRFDEEGNPIRTEIEASFSILAGLDLDKKLKKKAYNRDLKKYQGWLNRLHRMARSKGISTILVFEGWDAAGKGGAIRRITASLDARDYQVISIAAPTDEEKVQHYLWRFWRHLSRAGRVTIFDRSWYGRVLVERLEGFASRKEWRRAYAEINAFEQQLVDFGIVLVKFWIHIDKDEQEARFKARELVPYKRWKLTDEDWRNREKWDEYEVAVNDMIERTSTRLAPWVLVEGNDKRYSRIKVIRTLVERLAAHLGVDPYTEWEVPEAPAKNVGKKQRLEDLAADELEAVSAVLETSLVRGAGESPVAEGAVEGPPPAGEPPEVEPPTKEGAE